MIDKSGLIVSIWQPKTNKWKKQGYTHIKKGIVLASLYALLAYLTD